MTSDIEFSTPRNWVDANDAYILFFQDQENDVATAQSLDSLTSMIGSDAQIHIFAESDTPPWKRDDIAALLGERSHRQCVLICPSANSFYAACAVFSLEIGYDTYVVLQHKDQIHQVELLRLEHIGARVILFDQLLKDVQLALSK